MRGLAQLIIGGMLVSGIAAAAENPGAPAGNAERGKQVYIQHLCQNCHGTVGQGGERGAGPKLVPDLWPYPAFLNQVRRPRQVMPPYTAKNVSDQDLADMYAYLASLKRGPAAKDIPLLNR